MAITAQELNVILSARDKQFTKAMDRASNRVARFASKSKKDLGGTSAAFGQLASAAKRFAPVLAAAFSVNQLQNMVNSTAEIGNLAEMAGVGTTKFQELAFASSNFGIQQDKLADILKDVNDKFGDYAATGAGPLADFFENIAPKVGLTADAFADLSSEQKLGAYVNALEAAGVSQQEMTFYMEALASDATLLQGVFKNNGEELDRLSKKLRDAGGVMSDSLIKEAREAKEELAIASQVIKANLNVALADLIPLLVGGAEAAAKIARNIGIAYSAVHEFLNPNAQLETALDNVVLAMGDEIRQSRQLNIQLGKSKDMSVAMATEKLDEAEARHANAQAAIDEARALVLLSPTYKNLSERVGQMRETLAGMASPISGPKLTQQEAYEELEQSIVDAQKQLFAMLNTNTDLAEQAGITAENINTLRTALDNAKDGMVSFGNGVVEPITKSDRLAGSAGNAAVNLEKLIAQLDLSPISLQALGLGAGATAQDLDNLKSVMNTLDSEMESAFMNMVDGTKSFKDAVSDMARAVIKELYRVYVVQSLVAGIKQIFGLPDLSGGGAVQGGAHGRQLHAGTPYMTGESGRELFVPSTPGRLLSPSQTNNAMGAGGGVVVNQTINLSTGVSQTVRAEVQGMMPRITEATKAAVADAARRGGPYAKAFS